MRLGIRSAAHIFNLPAEFVVEEAGAEDKPLAEEGLLHATFVGARGRSGKRRDVQSAEQSTARRCLARKL